jgi:hypothetical protein
MGDIYKHELREGVKFANNADEAETLDAYSAMLLSEKEAKNAEKERIKLELKADSKLEFEKLQSNLLESLTDMKKFILKHNLRSDDLDKLVESADDGCKEMSELIVETLIKE